MDDEPATRQHRKYYHLELVASSVNPGTLSAFANAFWADRLAASKPCGWAANSCAALLAWEDTRCFAANACTRSMCGYDPVTLRPLAVLH